MKYVSLILASLCWVVGIAAGQEDYRTARSEVWLGQEGKICMTPFLSAEGLSRKEALGQEKGRWKKQERRLSRTKEGNPVAASVQIPSLELKTVVPYVKSDKAKITVDVQIDWRDGSGYRLLLDSDHNTYGVVIPENLWMCEGDVPEDVMDEFEVTIPGNATGLLDDSTWIFPFEKVSVEIEPGVYDYVVTLPSPSDGICYISSGEVARGDDFVFQAGSEYIFTMVVDLPSDKCILTADCQKDIAVTNLVWPETAVGLTDSEIVQVEVVNTGKKTIESFKLAYSLNEGDMIEETVTMAIEPGSRYVHAFSSPIDLSREGAYSLAVVSQMEDDGFSLNNRKESVVHHVKPVSAPFLCDFDDESDMDRWLVVNRNEDEYSWLWVPYNQWDPSVTGDTSGGGFAAINCLTKEGSDDWLLTFNPIHLSAGDAHIRFYYSGAYGMESEQMSVYYGKSSNVSKMMKLQSYDEIRNPEWVFSTLNFNVEEEGDYYFAFHAESSPNGGQLKVDEVEIAEGRFMGIPDLAVNFIVLPYSSCALTDSERVGVNITNKGTGDITKYTLSYSVNDGDFITQTFADTLRIGMTETVYFTNSFDFSGEGESYVVAVKGSVLAQEGEKPEENSTLEDNEAAFYTSHFSPAELPFQVDLSTEQGQGQWGCEYGAWVYDTESRSIFATRRSPLISRCMNLVADKQYRVTYFVMAIDESYDIVCGQPGTPIETWDTIASYRNFNKYDFQEPEEVIFAVPTDGAYSVAFLPGNSNSWFYLMETFTVSEMAEHDICIVDYSTVLGRLTPVTFASKPSFDVRVENRGIWKASSVHLTLRHGETLVAVSDTVDFLEQGMDTLISITGLLSELHAGTTVELTLEAFMSETDGNEIDNQEKFVFEATDTEYAFDSVGDMPTENPLPYPAYALGQVFFLPESDTLTAIRFGCKASEIDFPMGVAVYPVDMQTGKPGTAIVEKSIMRGMKAGFRSIEIPACLLVPGHYFVALRLYTSLSPEMSIVACDRDQKGHFYLWKRRNEPLECVSEGGDGYVAVRALFGHGAHVIAKDVEVVSIDKPGDKDIFTENEKIEVTLKNNGFDSLSGLKVICRVNGIEQEKSIEMGAYETLKIDFEENMMEPGYYDIYIEAHVDGDEVEENDTLSRRVRCISVDPYAMDFEFCEDFATENFVPAWTTFDADGGETFGFQDATFPHENEPFAFIAFNPLETEPASPLQANNGKRFGACFSSYAEEGNDDWLISPMLTIPDKNPELSFFVQSYTPAYGLEKYSVWISVSDNQIESFSPIGETKEAPAYVWKEERVDLSDFAGKKAYVAIRCVSQDAFVFMIDDIEIRGTVDTLRNMSVSDWENRMISYPNPVSEIWTVSTYGMDINHVEIFDRVGRAVYRSSHNLRGETYRLDMSSFETGLYVARIHTNLGIRVMKVIVAGR